MIILTDLIRHFIDHFKNILGHDNPGPEDNKTKTTSVASDKVDTISGSDCTASPRHVTSQEECQPHMVTTS